MAAYGSAAGTGEKGFAAFLRSGGLSAWLLRIVALVLLAIALQYWARLTGLYGSGVRFDTMPQHWRLAATFLAVALPVTALGLWSGGSWGVVLWLPLVGLELLMYGWFSDLYGRDDIRIAFHLSSIVLFGCLVALERFMANRA
jgi:Family of unknown function (DUF6163)